MSQETAANIIGPGLGLFFLFAGARKLYGWEWAENHYRNAYPMWVYYASAVVEVVAGVGLVVPATRLPSTLLQLGLIVALSVKRWTKAPEAKVLYPAVVSTSLLGWLAYVYWP
jgi:hypothetical protein